MTEKVQYKKTIATAMASFAFLTFGILSLVSCSAMDINSVTTFLTKSIPAACALGFLGYLLGNIFDDKRIIRKRGNLKAGLAQALLVNDELNAKYHEKKLASSSLEAAQKTKTMDFLDGELDEG